VTPGAFLGALPASQPASYVAGFVAKLAPAGNALLESSFIGGNYATVADSVAVDADGNLYIAGCTQGFDQFVAPAGSLVFVQFEPVPGVLCNGQAYALKLDPAARSEIYLNYIGAVAGVGENIAVDGTGTVWISGSAVPLQVLPIPTVHPFQARTGSGFVSEYSADGATLLFSSLVDSANGMAMDGSGNVFLSGFTYPASKIISFPGGFGLDPSVLVVRIDSAVSSAVTVEDPQRITPGVPVLAFDQGVAPGEILVLTGNGLGPAQPAGAQIGPDGKLATTLAGTSVTFDGIPAPLLSAQANQVVCLVPFEIPLGLQSTTVMQVASSGATSNSIRLPTAATAVEAFSLVNQDGAANTKDHPATPGSVVTIYAAGLGQTNPPAVDGAINGTAAGAPPAGPVAINIYADSGNPVDILFAGPAPGQAAGIMQINFRVPQLAPGQYTVAVGVLGDPNTSLANTFADYDVITLNVGQP